MSRSQIRCSSLNAGRAEADSFADSPSAAAHVRNHCQGRVNVRGGEVDAGLGIGLAYNLVHKRGHSNSHDQRAGICVSCLEFNPSPNFNECIRQYFEPIDWMDGVSGHKSKQCNAPAGNNGSARAAYGIVVLNIVGRLVPCW